MFNVFQDEKLITICMLGFLGISILIRMLLGAFYQNMIKETDNMSSTENKLLKQCKVKFANCYQLNNGVANIPVFVDKFLNRLSLGPLSFETMYHLSGQTMLLSVVCAGVGICKSIMNGKMLGEILPFYIVSFLGLYLYFSISTVVDVRGKRRVLKVNLVDYLENHLSARIDVTERDMEMLYGTRRYSGRGKNGRLGESYGRRTVELMPIGGRIAVAGATEEFVIDDEEKIAEVENEMAQQRKQAGEGNKVERENVSDRNSEIQVSEEELEILLKEFLTV